MTPTARLYFDDPLALAFDATVTAHARFLDRPSIVLDRSAFYPEAGGQPGDTGQLDALDVLDVQVDAHGVVHHLVAADAALPAPGARVHGAVSRDRRRLHMALHTGQHMLSRALLDIAQAETVSSRLSPAGCTVDVELPALDERKVAEAVAQVNRVVEDDRPVRAWFPDPEALRALPLRRAPKVTENVRVVSVEGFDVSPCGGTHCTRTAQVGVVTVTGVERYKGRTRVTFLAGRAAREELQARASALVEIGRMFSTGPHEARASIERLRADLAAARDALALVRDRWAASRAAALVARGDAVVVDVLDGESVDTLRALGARLGAYPGVVAILGARTAEGMQVLATRGDGSAFDCGAWLKRAAAAHGGRGGGRPERAEGRLPADVDLDALARA